MLAKVVASSNGSVGMDAAMEVLRDDGSPLNAVLAGLAAVEANPDDHSVGYGGLPNLLGEVELDASVMVGDGLRAGSVAALKGYQDAGQLAARVMEDLPHVLIAGDGASRFAAESGFESRDLLTDDARQVWQARLDGQDASSRMPESYLRRVRDIVGALSSDPQLVEDTHGTVDFICQARNGNIASGVSTSGWAWKYPGRVGDSPIIGAGNYADDAYGAAACTGRGEMAQRACTAHSVVMFLRFGADIETAVITALQDLRRIDDPYVSEMNIVALDRNGQVAAGSTAPNKTFVYQDQNMNRFEERSRFEVPLEG